MKKDIFLLVTALILLPYRAACGENIAALVVVGGHAYDTTEFLDVFTSLNGIDFEMVSHPDAFEVLDSKKIQRFDVVLFYDYIPDWPLKDSTVLLTMADTGIPMLFLHHSLCNFQRWSRFQEVVGGRYIISEFELDSAIHSNYQHDITLHIKVVDTSHPITKGMEDFTIHDEGYYNLHMEEGIEPLLVTDHPRCNPVVGWVNRYGHSTCVYLMLGHDRNAYENPSFRQLVENSVHWLSRDH